MEKEKIKFSYAESGVKTLNALTYVFYFLAALSLIIGIIFMSDTSFIFDYGKTSIMLYTLVFVLLFSYKHNAHKFKRLIAE